MFSTVMSNCLVSLIVLALTASDFTLVNAASSCSLFTPGTAAALTSTPTACNFVSTNAPFNDTDRQNLAARLNLYRAQLANGCAVQQNGQYAPSGSNIIELVYNCTLEQQAQAWADQCQFAFSPSSDRPGSGETVYGIYSNAADIGNTVAQSIDAFWQSLQTYGNFTSTNTQLVDGNLASWAQLAWGTTSSFGCGYAKCPNSQYGYLHTIICNFYPGGDYLNVNIYQPGSPCEVNADCTSAGYGQCDSALGLCSSGVSGNTTPAQGSTTPPAPTTTTAPRTNSTCAPYAPGSATTNTVYFNVSETCSGINTGSGFNGAARTAAVNRHNQWREQLAHGCSLMPNNTYAPPAQNMLKMVYNCSLEAIAQSWANNCQFKHSGRPYGENLWAVITNGNFNQNAFSDASDSWWSELVQYGGINSTNTILTMSNFNLGIGHWSQMAWAASTSVGCGFATCPQSDGSNMFYVVCNYSPQGNIINYPIYTIGSPCQQNSDCTVSGYNVCEVSTGLCTSS